jgi:hypothetical protein
MIERVADEHHEAPEPSSDERLIARFNHHTPRRAWRIFARNQARVLYDAVREAEGGAHKLTEEQQLAALLIRQGIYRSLTAASFKARGRPEQLKDWYSGSAIETTWSELHRAGERLLLVQDASAVLQQIPDIDAALRSNLKADDPRLTPAITNLAKLAKARHVTAAVREELRHYQEVANNASDEAHTNVRSLRNLLIVIGASVTMIVALLAGLHAVIPSFLDFSVATAKPPVDPVDAVEAWEVVAVGAFGGAIAAVFTIARLGGYGGPYRLPVYQALIRVPAGAAVALAAVLLLQSKQIQALSPQNGLSVLAVALLFGYSPDVFLRFMDQKAASLLSQAQGKDDPSGPPLTKPLADLPSTTPKSAGQ